MSLPIHRAHKAGQILITQLRLHLPPRIQDLSAAMHDPDFLPQGTKGQNSQTLILWPTEV